MRERVPTAFSPGDRVEHNDGRIGSVRMASKNPRCQIVRWDDGYRQTVRDEELHLIRSKGK